MLEPIRTALQPCLPAAATRVARVTARMLKHRTGKRAVIEYRLHDADGEDPFLRLVGKLYRKQRGVPIYALMKFVESQFVGEASGIIPVYAYIDEFGLILQAHAAGQELSAVTATDVRERAVRQLGHTLARLHDMPLEIGNRRGMAQHIEKYCHPGIAALQRTVGDESEQIAQLVNALLAVDLSDSPPSLVHGDINLTQVFVDADGIVLIDWDSACLTHPALDMANFCVVLATHFPEKGAQLQKVFLEGYRKALPLHFEEYQAFAYLRRAMIALRQLTGTAQSDTIRHCLEMAQGIIQRR